MKIINQNKKADIKIIFLKNKNSKTPIGFTGKKGEMVVSENNLIVGTNGITDSEDWRVIGVKITQKLKSLNVATAAIKVPKKSGEFIEGLVLGDYSFDKYKTTSKSSKLKAIYINSKDDITNVIKTSVDKAMATCLTRDWVNTTPEDANSVTIEDAIIKIFKQTNIDVEVYKEKQLEKFGMNLHLAVNRASRHEAKTIKLTYTPKKYNKHCEHHVFVGKGLTYDSGGLSIKPGNHMTTMKADKAGAMTLLGAMQYIANHGSKHKITTYLCLAENMISGDSYKPDDILTAMNGKTVHVKNTDAEGRLVLFDNICLAQKQNNDITTIHSIATLTGAAVYCFGDEVAALVGFNDKLKTQIQKAGTNAGEIYMDAAFHKYMLDGVDDTIADLSNTGTSNMGCQKAGLFLTKAIDKKNNKKYVHWDIAGPAFVPKAYGHNPVDATGFGVRTIIDLVC